MRVYMFGRVACLGCQRMKPELKAAAESKGIIFEYIDLDTQEGEDFYNQYQGLSAVLPVVLFTDYNSVPVNEMKGMDWLDFDREDFKAYIDENVTLDGGTLPTTTVTAKSNSKKMKGVAAAAAVAIGAKFLFFNN